MKICIDVGGTNTIIAAVENDTVISKKVVPTEVDYQGTQFLAWLKTLVAREMAVAVPDVCVALPGLVNRNMLIHAPALPYCDRLSFNDWKICNDADAAALAEHRYGAAKDAQNAVVITFGTSVGAGVIVGGELLTGCEAGHMFINKDANSLITWEEVASTGALVRRCREKHPTVSWAKNGQTIFDAARKGESLAKAAIAEHVTNMAVGIANIIAILAPEIVVIGGGICESFDYFGEELKKQTELLLAYPNTMPPIVAAKLGNDAGVIGACI